MIDELITHGYKPEQIIIVDGYSNDGTPELAKQKGVRVIFQHGQGKTGAVVTAIENVKTPYMLLMDGDYTYDPKDIEKFLAHAEMYDEIIGLRITEKKRPIIKRFGNWLVTKIFNMLISSNLSDVCSGMYLLKTEKARQLHFKSSSFEVEVEIASQIATSGKITEVPINYRKRIGKQKLNSLKHGLKILTSIIKLAQSYNPALFFSLMVAITAIPGAIILIWVLIERLLFEVWHSGFALLGVALLLFGAQALTIAIISLLLKRMEHRILQKVS